MQFVKPDVSTLCVGQAASMGACCSPRATRTSASACEFTRDDSPADGRLPGPGLGRGDPRQEILYMRQRLNEIMAEHTGRPSIDSRDTDRETNFLSAQEAGSTVGGPGARSRAETAAAAA